MASQARVLLTAGRGVMDVPKGRWRIILRKRLTEVRPRAKVEPQVQEPVLPPPPRPPAQIAFVAPRKFHVPSRPPMKTSREPLKAPAIVSGAARKGPPSVVPFSAGTCHKVYLPSLSDHADDGRFVRAEGHRYTHDLPPKAVRGGFVRWC